MPRMLRCSVPDVPDDVKKMYKNTMGKMGLLILGLYN